MDYTELFDRYIDGLLEGKELEDFKRKLNSDMEFKKNLEKYISLHNAAIDSIGEREGEEMEMGIDKETDKLSQKDIANWGREKRGIADKKMSAYKEAVDLAEKDFLKGKIRVVKKNLPLQLAIAATVVVALLITALIFLRQNKLTHPDLFTKYYEPYVKSEEVFEITRSSDNFYYAVKVFEAGDYARAALLFMQLSDSSELKVYATFYAGLNCIQMGKWEDAVTKLQEVVTSGETKINNVARWYLGLCFLRIDDSESARLQFEKLASEKNEFTARSKRILRLMH
jgi:hypothetical protein